LPFVNHSVQNILPSCLPKILKIKIYKTLPVVLYGCETWSLTLREEYRLRVTENRILKRIFRPKREEVSGGQRILHKEELQNLYNSPNIITVMKSRRVGWVGHIACMERCEVYTEFWLESLKGRDHLDTWL
jgi:hypothetical protein